MAGQTRQAKVLCIRIIQGSNVLDKTIDPGDSVTVGESAKNTFVIPKTHLGQPEFQLFKAVGNGYVLRFTEGMTGKVESKGSVVKLPSLYSDDSVTKQGSIAQLPLTEQDRGKVKIDQVTVLFQFLPPPPTQALKPLAQMDFRPRLLQDDDPAFLGFLGIWTALATVLVLWVWNTEPREYSLEQAPDRFVQMILPKKEKPPEVEKPEEIEQVEPDQVLDVKPPEPEPKEVEPKEVVEQPQQTDEERKIAEAQRQEKRKKELLEGSALLKIGTLGEGKGLASEVWGDSGPGNDVGDALKEGKVVVENDHGPRKTSSEGTEAIDNVELTQTGGGPKTAEVDAVAVQLKPTVRSGTGGSIDVTGDEGAVKDVVSKYMGQLTYCYEKRLKVVPTLEGRIEMSWEVAGGRVTGKPFALVNGTGDGELEECIANKIRRWRFPADVEGSLSWPFAFQAKK